MDLEEQILDQKALWRKDGVEDDSSLFILVHPNDYNKLENQLTYSFITEERQIAKLFGIKTYKMDEMIEGFPLVTNLKSAVRGTVEVHPEWKDFLLWNPSKNYYLEEAEDEHSLH